MGVTYTQGSDLAVLEPAKLAERLEDVIVAAMGWLGKIDELDASRPEREGKWSAKQIIGHLTDSAVNNLPRIVRMQIATGQSFAGYEQEEWVALQQYQAREWSQVLAVWAVLNGQVAWTIAHVDKTKLANMGTIEGSELTLGFLIEDYIAHMEHHLRHIRAGLAD